MEMLFFFLFACVLAGMYMSIRRHWAPPANTAMVGMGASIVTMTLFLLSRTSVLQGIVLGIFAGVLFGGATLIVAWYFHSAELRAEFAGHGPVDDYDYAPEPQPEEYYE